MPLRLWPRLVAILGSRRSRQVAHRRPILVENLECHESSTATLLEVPLDELKDTCTLHTVRIRSIELEQSQAHGVHRESKAR